MKGKYMEKNEYLAYYMEFDNKYTGKLNKYGGLPTHLPPQWPADERFGGWTFLCQFYCDGKMLSIPDTLCIQVYQLMIDGIQSSDPIVVQVPIGAEENREQLGTADEYLQENDINFREVCEEITEESYRKLEDKNGNKLMHSKFGGWYPFMEEKNWHFFTETEWKNKSFLGAMRDEFYTPFCWGCDYSLIIFLNELNQVEWKFY